MIIDAASQRTLSSNTILDYQRQYDRLQSKSEELNIDIWQAAAATNKNATWWKRRTSILYGLEIEISFLMAEQARLGKELSNESSSDSRWNLWSVLVNDLSAACIEYAAVPNGSPLKKIIKRKSKRRQSHLPDDWRERLVARLPRWKSSFLVAAVTGCRPAELLKGVELLLDGDVLIAVIFGAKLGANSGQHWRELYWDLNQISNTLIIQLANIVRLDGGSVTISLGNENKNPRRAFSDAIRSAARREWPNVKETVTAYSLRHRAATDSKSSELSSSETSALLGHCVIDTKSSYGFAAQGLQSRISPQRVAAARPVIGEPTELPSQKNSQIFRERG